MNPSHRRKSRLALCPLEDRITPAFDFGDAPDLNVGTGAGNYQTTPSDDGPRHVVGGPRLGNHVDSEDVPIPYLEGFWNRAYGYGDNTFGSDEDGVVFDSLLNAGSVATPGTVRVDVQNAANARLNGWLDFNRNGSFADAGEHIVANLVASTGTYNLAFTVPAGASSGKTFARFRIGTETNLGPSGLANDGEVEDLAVMIHGQASTAVFVDAILAHRQTIGEYQTLRTNIDPSFYAQGTNKAYFVLDPYYSSFAVRALLAAPNVGQHDKYAFAIKHLQFWLSRRLADGSIPRIIVDEQGTVATSPLTSQNNEVFDPATIGADADDSALAMMLLVASDLWTSGGPSGALATFQADLNSVGNLLTTLIEPNGLPRPFVDTENTYRKQQTLDCMEVLEALRQFAEMQRYFYQNASGATEYAAKATTVANAIQTLLFDGSTQLYRQYAGAESPNLNTWYPIVNDQAWPIITGHTPGDSPAARQLLDAVYAAWDGSPNIAWNSRTDAVFLAWAAVRAGDRTLAATAVETIESWALQNSHPVPALTPMTVADYGYLVQTLLPTMNAIPNRSIDEDSLQQTVNLSGIAKGIANGTQTLALTASSDNTGLIPNPTVVYTSANPTGELRFTPVPNAFGTATVTVVVDDGQASSNTVTRTFNVTVNPVNDLPTLAALTDLNLSEDAPEQTVNLGGISSGAANEPQTLVVTATSSNPGLIPNPTVTYTSPGLTGTLKFTPVTNLSGSATITVVVDDGSATITRTFVVAVSPVNDAPTAVNDGPFSINSSVYSISPLTNDTDIEGNPLSIVGFTQPANGVVTRVGNVLRYHLLAASGGLDSFQYTISDGQGGTSTATINVNVVDTIAPKVAAAQVIYGTSNRAIADLATVGRTILPWANITRYSLTFSEAVNPATLNLLINGGAIAPSAPVASNGGKTFTWTFPTLALGRYTFRLSGTVTDFASPPNPMGSDFVRSFGVLPGDFDGNGIVNSTDTTRIRALYNNNVATANRFADINGDGVVNALDLAIAQANLGKHL
jgi:Bacterial Ig domain/GEVED domain/Dockerin type I domain